MAQMMQTGTILKKSDPNNVGAAWIEVWVESSGGTNPKTIRVTSDERPYDMLHGGNISDRFMVGTNAERTKIISVGNAAPIPVA